MPPVAPVQLMSLESTYFIVVFLLCMLIYTKTKEAYYLTKHQGIKNFRHIFLYFALAYLFRLITITSMMSRELFLIDMIREVHALNLILLGYFSTIGLLSITLTIINQKKEIKHSTIIINATAILISIIALVTFSPQITGLAQTIILIVTVILLNKTRHNEARITTNKIMYLLILFAWVINLYLLNTRGPIELKIPLYIVSIIIFYSIYARVNKRLHNDKTKRPS